VNIDNSTLPVIKNEVIEEKGKAIYLYMCLAVSRCICMIISASMSISMYLYLYLKRNIVIIRLFEELGGGNKGKENDSE
jgi:hypothetical protein